MINVRREVRLVSESPLWEFSHAAVNTIVMNVLKKTFGGGLHYLFESMLWCQNRVGLTIPIDCSNLFCFPSNETLTVMVSTMATPLPLLGNLSIFSVSQLNLVSYCDQLSFGTVVQQHELASAKVEPAEVATIECNGGGSVGNDGIGTSEKSG